MAETYDWATDPFWTAPFQRFQDLARHEGSSLTFDVRRLEAACYGDAIYKHIDCVIAAEEIGDFDGRRYLPRLMMALLMILHEEAGAAP